MLQAGAAPLVVLPTAETDRLLSVAIVATKLNVSKATVYTLIERGDLPTVRIVNRRLVTPEDLAAFVARQRKGGDS